MPDAVAEPAESAPPSPQGVEDLDHDEPKENDSHEGLRITTLVGPDEDHVNGEQPDIDIVHVMGVKPEDERLSLESFISGIKSKRRELVFNVDVSSLMTGDFSMDAIEHQAQQLLEGLSYFRQFDGNGNSSGRAIVFVAYELGGLIVKKALSMAGIYRDRWPNIFSHSARFVFCGCFQRSHDFRTLERKISEFMYANRSDKWERYLDPSSLTAIAKATLEMTEIFLSSRVTLCSRVISLYANAKKPGKIHPVFDYFTSTLGLPAELPLQEQSEPQFPHLPEMVCFQVKTWVPNAAWAPIEQTLISLALPHRQSFLESPACSHPILESLAHKTWAKSNGIRILYIESDDRQAKREAAEQVFLWWQTKQREKEEYWAKNFSFCFSARDPSRDTIDDMIASLVLQASPRYDSSTAATDEYRLMKDQYDLQHGWTEKDLHQIFTHQSYRFLGTGTLLLLQDVEQCNRESLAGFWQILKVEGAASEFPLKLVVTSKKGRALLDGLEPDVAVDKYIIPDKKDSTGSFSDDDYTDSLVLRLCPNGHGQSRVRKSLLNLRSLDRDTAEQILELIQARTGWPVEPTTENLSMFCSFLESTSRASTPTTVLDYVLRADPDQDGLRWILSWLLCAFRPLTRREMAMVYCQRSRDVPLSKPSSADLQCAKTAIEKHLRGIAEFSHDQVYIRDDVVALFKPGRDYIWTYVKETAPELVMDYILRSFSTWETEGRFESLYQLYQSQATKSEQDFTAPLIPDGEDIIFYAIQALPTHLAESIGRLDSIAQELMGTAGRFASWARVYWAMSNPFCRPVRGPHTSAYDTLLDFGNLSPGARPALKELKDRLSTWRSPGEPDKAQIMSLFTEAVRTGNEELALRYAKAIDPPPKDLVEPGETNDQSKVSVEVSSLQWALWRATLLNMERLAHVVLEKGIDPDAPDITSLRCSSPLYMAARLGHTGILADLIAHEANLSVNKASYNALYVASANGHIDAIKLLAAKEPSLMEANQSPLYTACYWGKWRAVETLLDLNADPHEIYEPEPNTKSKPLLIASREGHLRTIKALLTKKIDLNTYGTSNVLNPLYLAAVTAGSSESVRILLENGADPNHELINPPLVLEMLRSTIPADDRLQILELLIANDPPGQINVVGDLGVTPLMCAAANGQATLAKWLLEHGADVNAATDDGWTALFYAVNSDYIDVVRELLPYKPRLDVKLASGATINQIVVGKALIFDLLLNAEPSLDLEYATDFGSTALGCAISQREPEAVKLLLARKVNIHWKDSVGWSPILDATGYICDANITRMLAESGANLQDTVPDGRSPLHLAAVAGTEVLQTVLEFRKGIDLEKRDDQSRTPLLYALSNGASTECIKLLVRAGVDVNAQDNSGRSPLTWSSYRNDGVAEFFLSQPDININLQSVSFGSALHVACDALNSNLVSKLLERGADPNVDWPGRTASSPIMTACLSSTSADGEEADQIDKIVRMLVAHGAKINDEDTKANGRSISNSLLAACLGASTGTIRFLLDEGASLQQQTETMKLLPIHLAAVNSVRNFEFVAQMYQGDLLVADSTGKNVLHWAAQYSHAETIRHILDKVAPSVKERRRCLDLVDIDGWTPLAWATRPCKDGWSRSTQSEPRDIAKTIKYLLEEGSDPSIEFRIGQGDDTETFTPLTMATLCDLGEDVINMLRDAQKDIANRKEETDLSTPARKYSYWYGTCDICTSTIYGQVHLCQTCGNFDACKKCYGRIQTYHGHLRTSDGEPHVFKLRAGCEKEFQDLPEDDLPKKEADDQEQTKGPGGQAEVDGNASANDKGNVGTSEDDVDDGLNLDDLDNLVDEEEGSD